MRTVCTSCGAAGMEVFHAIDGVPTNSCILLPTREEAQSYPCGDVRLAFCRHCGFISNIAFDPKLTEYSGRYEETQAFSPTFNAFHDKLAHALVELGLPFRPMEWMSAIPSGFNSLDICEK